MTKPILFIATPIYGDSVKTQYFRSMLKLIGWLERATIRYSFIHVETADVALSRNYLATVAYESQATHLLFVDSDVSFEPESVRKLLDADKDVIGCVYPARQIMPGETIRDFAANRFVAPWTGSVADAIAEVPALGMGLTLIRTEVLGKLAPTVSKRSEHPPSTSRKVLKGPLLGFFDYVTLDDDRGYAGEDRSFCMRWRLAGGKLYALTTEMMGHVSSVELRGRYSDHIRL